MKVLVTGAGGFVGRHAVHRLLSEGTSVVALDRDLSALAGDGTIDTIEGDLDNEACLAEAFDRGAQAVVHLAAVPGGAAEGDANLSFQVNVDATLRLMRMAATRLERPRFVFSSTIAVFGDPLPAGGVDDATPLRPKLNYGMHKLMIETALATMTRRGEIDGVGMRLPGIIARPPGAAGMKSAFMSDVFHALLAGEAMTLPVSPEAQLWLMSVEQCAANIQHALTMDSGRMPENRVVTLPALRVGMQELAQAAAAACGAGTTRLDYAPDAGLEAAFGAHPPLSTQAADKAGFAHDGSVEKLVTNAIATIRQTD